MIENLIEFIFGLGLFINAALFIPQAMKLFRTKSANGLSITTFAGFNAVQLFTILHGFLHQDYLLMLGMSLSLVSCGLVTVLIFLYRHNTDK